MVFVRKKQQKPETIILRDRVKMCDNNYRIRRSRKSLKVLHFHFVDTFPQYIFFIRQGVQGMDLLAR